MPSEAVIVNLSVADKVTKVTETSPLLPGFSPTALSEARIFPMPVCLSLRRRR
jgi:hypothetical protein